MRRELGDTLAALVEGATPDAGTGMSIQSVELAIPLEIALAVDGDRVTLVGGAPHSRWQSGVLPPVHRARLVIEAVEDGGESRDR